MKTTVRIFSLLACLSVSVWAPGQNTPFVLLKNKGGQTWGYSPESGIKILIIDDLSFKDLYCNKSTIKARAALKHRAALAHARISARSM
jgi:beta-glucosidase